eukprot:scaffold49890_cov29-Tisochrysis_lutea.AAC.2
MSLVGWPTLPDWASQSARAGSVAAFIQPCYLPNNLGLQTLPRPHLEAFAPWCDAFRATRSALRATHAWRARNRALCRCL